MSRRDQIRMTEDEARAFLEASKTIIVVSNGPNGFPHPMPMWFALDPDGSIRMTTYRNSQKVQNLRRDPRVTVLAEAGLEYEELRSVVLYGRAEVLEDQETIVDTLLAASRGPGEPRPAGEQLEGIRAGMLKTAAKRVCIRVKPERTVSWDHRKLGGVY